MDDNIYFRNGRVCICILLVSAMTALCSCDHEKGSSKYVAPDTHVQSEICSCTEGDGSYYTYADGLIDAAAATLDLDLVNRATTGSLKNAQLIADGDCAMGLVQEDTFRYLKDKAGESVNPMNSIMASKLKVIMTAYEEQAHFLVNTETVSDVDGDGSITPGDLEGKSIGIGPESSGTNITAKYILKSFGLDASNCTLDSGDTSLAIARVQSGDLDAMFVVSSVPYAPLASESLADAPIQLMRCCLKSGTQYGMYSEKGTIDYTSYPFQEEAVSQNLQVRSLVAVSDGFDTSNLQDFYDYLEENKGTFGENYDANWSAFSVSNSETLVAQNPLIMDYSAAEIASGYDFSDLDLNFYTGTEDGNFEKIADDIDPFIQSCLDYDLEAVNSTGSGQSATGILRGDAAMAIVQDDVYDYLASLDDSYEGMKAAKMKKVMPLYAGDVLFVVNRASEIDSVSDLAGKKVCLCEKTSSSFISGIRIINSYGFDMTNAPTYYFAAPADGLARVVAREYDAVVLVDARPSSMLTALSAENAALVKLIPAAVKDGTTSCSYSTTTILQSDYSSLMPDGDIAENAQVMALLVISSSADSDEVGDLIERIYLENGNDTLASASGWDSVTMSSGRDYFRINPYGWSMGAIKYYDDRLFELL